MSDVTETTLHFDLVGEPTRRVLRAATDDPFKAYAETMCAMLLTANAIGITVAQVRQHVTLIHPLAATAGEEIVRIVEAAQTKSEAPDA